MGRTTRTRPTRHVRRPRRGPLEPLQAEATTRGLPHHVHLTRVRRHGITVGASKQGDQSRRVRHARRVRAQVGPARERHHVLTAPPQQARAPPGAHRGVRGSRGGQARERETRSFVAQRGQFILSLFLFVYGQCE